MARFLSDGWLARATELAAADDELRLATADVELTIQQVVTSADGVEVRYGVRVERGRVALEPGDAVAPDIVITQAYETASALSQGTLTPAIAFSRGLVKVRGDVAELVRHHDAVARLHDVFGPLRERTEY